MMLVGIFAATFQDYGSFSCRYALENGVRLRRKAASLLTISQLKCGEEIRDDICFELIFQLEYSFNLEGRVLF